MQKDWDWDMELLESIFSNFAKKIKIESGSWEILEIPLVPYANYLAIPNLMKLFC
jgi:hypothetical protein